MNAIFLLAALAAAPGDDILIDDTVSVAEGAGSVAVGITLVTALAEDITVRLTASAGTAGIDDFGAGSVDVFVQAGQTSGSGSFTVTDDGLDENDETFAVAIVDVVVGSPSLKFDNVPAVVTILDDDAPPNVTIADASAVEGAGDAIVTATLSTASSFDVDVTVAFSPLDAESPADFDDTGVVITITAGQTSGSELVALVGDVLDEDDERFRATLTSANNATIVTGSGDGADVTIVDDDAAPGISITSLEPGNVVNGGVASFLVTLDAVSGRTVSGVVRPVTRTATAGLDFVADDVAFSIAAGALTDTANVAILNDALHENTETFDGTLALVINATVTVASVTVSILDDDTEPKVGFVDNAFSFAEASDGIVEVELSEVSGRDTIVTVTLGEASALDPEDFTSDTLSILIREGELVGAFPIPIVPDAIDEIDETFTLTISAADGASIPTNTDNAEATILDDDDAPSVSVIDASVTEDNATLNVVVRLSGPSGRAISVRANTAEGSAVEPEDFTRVNNVTVSLAAGATEAIVAVGIREDAIDEDDETLAVVLSTPVNVTLATASAEVTIVDDDAPPVISVQNAAAVTEGNSARFVVTLTGATAKPVSFDVATATGSAGAADFEALLATRTIAAGTTTINVDVVTINDGVDENDGETFALSISGSVDATVVGPGGVASASGSINDNDAPPTLAIASATVAEGDTGTATLSFPLTLSAASEREIRVTARTVAVAGGAEAGRDFTAQAATVLVLSPGTVTVPFNVVVVSDTIHDRLANETLTAELSSASAVNVTLQSPPTATGTIVDEDPAPELSIADATLAAETNDGVASLPFTITLDRQSELSTQVTVTTSLAGGTANAADVVVQTGLAVVAPLATSTTVNALVLGDTVDESDETFTAVLSAPVNGTIDDGSAVGTIVDDDNAPTLSIGDAVLAEAGGDLVFTVTLSARSGQPVSVGFATVANADAVGDVDFTTISGTVTIAVGQTSATVRVALLDDALDELAETFGVRLQDSVNAGLLRRDGLGTINDDDNAPNLTIGDVTLGEGDSAATASFRVALSAPSGRLVTVPVRTIGATAAATADFGVVDRTLSFAAGATELVVDVAVVGDRVDETDETFRLEAQAGVSGATVIDGVGVASVVDDDEAPVANSDSYQTDEEQALTVGVGNGVLANDSDGDGDALGATVVVGPTSAGTLTLAVDGSFVFTPAADFAGDAAFTYRSSDGVNAVDGRGTISVRNINDAPEVDAADVAVIRVDEDSVDPPGEPLDGLLDAVSDRDPGDRRGIVIVAAADAEGGSFEVSFDDGVTWQPLGPVSATAGRLLDADDDTQVRFVPPPNLDPIATLTFVAWDQTDTASEGDIVDTTARGGTTAFSIAEGTLRFEVRAVNDGPELVAPTPDGDVLATEGVELVITLAADDSDGPDEIFTLARNDLPATAIFDAAARTITWTPRFDEAGTYTVDVVVDDRLLTDTRRFRVIASFIDADADRVPDAVEAAIGTAVDSDDTDGDTILDIEELGPNPQQPRDSDGDSIIDALDDDSDADGVLDEDEAGDAQPGSPAIDSDADEVADFLDTDSDDDTRLDGDDNCRAVANGDQGDADGDLIGDACDDDADGDLLLDRLEPGLGLDASDPDGDDDSILDGVEAVGGESVDTDGDDTIDALDDDSDGDGLSDALEAGDAELLTAPRDTDGDGVADFIDVDADGDGVDDDTDNCLLDENPGQDDLDDDGVGDVCLQVCGDRRLQLGEECDEDSDRCGDDCLLIASEEVCDGIDNDLDGEIDVVSRQGNQGRRSVCEEDLEVVGGGVLGLIGCAQGGAGGLWLALLGLPLLLRRRRRSPLSAPTALLAVGFIAVGATVAPTAAQAQSQDGLAIAPFSPAPAGTEDFVLVEGTGAVGHMAPAGGIVVDYGHQALQIRDGATGAEVALLAHRVSADVVASLSLFDRFVVSAGVPVSLFQLAGSDDTFQPLTLQPVAVGDVRLAGRWAILDPKTGPGAALSTTVTLPSGDPAQLLGHGAVTVRPQLIGGWRFGEHLRVTGNVGYLIRPPQKLFNLRVGNEVTYAIGGELPLPLVMPFDDGSSPAGSLSALIEVSGRVSADPSITPSAATSPLETQVAARWAITGGHAVTAGTAVGITPGYGTPLVRAFVGYSFTWPTTDTDKDGIDDDNDGCPGDPEDVDGHDDGDGCPGDAEQGEQVVDPDGDGLVDPQDQCPDVAEDQDGFEDDDGCPDLDHDGDGVSEESDRCPAVAEDRDGHEDGDGCPDEDNDGDGFKDAADTCKNAAEVRNGYEDGDGCPDVAPAATTPPPATTPTTPLTTTPTTTPTGKPTAPEPPPFMTEPGRIDLPQRIYFATNGADLTSEGRRLLDQVVATLTQNPDIRVEVQGHTDGEGDAVSNDRLALRRAEAVAYYLVQSGIQRPRILIAILGTEEPLAPNDSLRGRALNRRVEFRVMEH